MVALAVISIAVRWSLRQDGLPTEGGREAPLPPAQPWENEKDPEKKVELLVAACRGEPGERALALHGIGELRLNHPKTNEALLDGIQDEHDWVAKEAAFSIARIHDFPPEFAVALARCIRPAPGRCNLQAMKALGWLEERGLPAVDQVLQLGLFDDPNPGVRSFACSLSLRLDDPRLLKAAARLVGDPDETVRGVARLAAEQLGERGLIQD
jgi:HEAT repeat protein